MVSCAWTDLAQFSHGVRQYQSVLVLSLSVSDRKSTKGLWEYALARALVRQHFMPPSQFSSETHDINGHPLDFVPTFW